MDTIITKMSWDKASRCKFPVLDFLPGCFRGVVGGELKGEPSKQRETRTLFLPIARANLPSLSAFLRTLPEFPHLNKSVANDILHKYPKIDWIIKRTFLLPAITRENKIRSRN